MQDIRVFAKDKDNSLVIDRASDKVLKAFKEAGLFSEKYESQEALENSLITFIKNNPDLNAIQKFFLYVLGKEIKTISIHRNGSKPTKPMAA